MRSLSLSFSLKGVVQVTPMYGSMSGIVLLSIFKVQRTKFGPIFGKHFAELHHSSAADPVVSSINLRWLNEFYI